MSALDLPPITVIHLRLAQYPILSREICQRMRAELFARGIINSERLEQEAKDKAIASQHLEGMDDPYSQEEPHIWEQRLAVTRDDLTTFYFATNLHLDLFHRLIDETVRENHKRRGTAALVDPRILTFNPERAPLDVNLRQADLFESLPPSERGPISHHLEEIIVVLTKTLISDDLRFLSIAKAWFSADDFKFILAHRIGRGKIGGKAAGMLLAYKMLKNAAPHLAEQVILPRSWFLGADVFYDFKDVNDLEYINQKYKPVEQIRAEYPAICAAFEHARFPEEIAENLRTLLAELGRTPLIVRSSSLLEDKPGSAFAGKYTSYFCPNQGTPTENLRDLTLAIRRVYASVYSPDVLIYRRRMGYLDSDERMAILIQEVQGQTYGGYFFPTLAGVAFSRSPIVWTPRLRREDGFVRLVLGLGTRAVERVGEDYPRLIFLSHPLLRPEKTPEAIAHYSQQWLDAIDLKHNALTSVPFRQVIDRDYPALRWVASLADSESGTLTPLNRLASDLTPERMVLTFDNLLNRSDFAPFIKDALATLARNYGSPVDVEFALTLHPDSPKPRLVFHILQCRTQSLHTSGEVARPVPLDLAPSDKLFFTTQMVPQGQVTGVEYLVYVDPYAYDRLPDERQRQVVASLVSRLNKLLEGKTFILIGPGRWGSSNLQLGVPVSYADIYNARALVELALGPEGAAPEPSYGTHFFQDLVEARIYSLAIHPDNRGDFLNLDFLNQAANHLLDFLPEAGDYLPCLKLIRVPAERAEHLLDIVMDGERALAFLSKQSLDARSQSPEIR